MIAVNNEPGDKVCPQVADFTFYGGLYRDVNIICVPESHFELAHHGGPGLNITPEIRDGDAQVEVETWIRNRQEGQRLRYAILDREGSENPASSAICRMVRFLSPISSLAQVMRWCRASTPTDCPKAS